MARIILLMAVLALCLAGCQSKEKDQLRTEVDSLRQQLSANEKMASTLEDVGELLDSIDANRQLLRINVVEGTTYNDYKARMEDLNKYVKETENKITNLEQAAGKSQQLAAAYAKMIKKMKADLQQQTFMIADLQEAVNKYRNENQNLVELASYQEAELNDKQQQIEAKQQELAALEERIQSVMVQSKVSEADGYYARAQAVEETANRTKLAPKKKKETLQQALDLYKKAESLGKKEATAKVKELEDQLK